jgi:hypothetical protein
MVLDFSLLSIYCISCTVPLADIGNGDGDWTHEFGAGSHIYRNKIIEQMRWQQRVLFHRQGPKLEFLKGLFIQLSGLSPPSPSSGLEAVRCLQEGTSGWRYLLVAVYTCSPAQAQAGCFISREQSENHSPPALLQDSRRQTPSSRSLSLL